MIAYDVLSREETLTRFPGMSVEGMDGSEIFYGGQVVWSERLCVEVVPAAHADGAAIFTYSNVRNAASLPAGRWIRGCSET